MRIPIGHSGSVGGLTAPRRGWRPRTVPGMVRWADGVLFSWELNLTSPIFRFSLGKTPSVCEKRKTLAIPRRKLNVPQGAFQLSQEEKVCRKRPCTKTLVREFVYEKYFPSPVPESISGSHAPESPISYFRFPMHSTGGATNSYAIPMQFIGIP